MEDDRAFDFGDGAGLVPAHRHLCPTGYLGGWVANTAYVSPEVHLMPSAQVYGGARVEGHGLLDEISIGGDARIRIGRPRPTESQKKGV